jgi:signal transduction histidine kinase
MNNAKDWFGYDNLAFFGKVSASISHELKNVMAIISETAGLLGDLSDMASTGKPIAPDMLKSCTDSIVEEIQRGFSTIRQMNRFAHSVDTPAESVNLMDMLDLTINLSEYLSFSGKTDLNPGEGFTPIATTCPFLLQTIVYETLVYTFKHTGPGAEISISIQPTAGSAWRIIFSGFNFSEFHVFPDVITKAMAASIGVIIYADSTADQLYMDVPLSIESLTAHPVSPEMSTMGNPSRTRA